MSAVNRGVAKAPVTRRSSSRVHALSPPTVRAVVAASMMISGALGLGCASEAPARPVRLGRHAGSRRYLHCRAGHQCAFPQAGASRVSDRGRPRGPLFRAAGIRDIASLRAAGLQGDHGALMPPAGRIEARNESASAPVKVSIARACPATTSLKLPSEAAGDTVIGRRSITVVRDTCADGRGIPSASSTLP